VGTACVVVGGSEVDHFAYCASVFFDPYLNVANLQLAQHCQAPEILDTSSLI
jgi:hypothetical protein